MAVCHLTTQHAKTLRKLRWRLGNQQLRDNRLSHHHRVRRREVPICLQPRKTRPRARQGHDGPGKTRPRTSDLHQPARRLLIRPQNPFIKSLQTTKIADNTTSRQPNPTLIATRNRQKNHETLPQLRPFSADQSKKNAPKYSVNPQRRQNPLQKGVFAWRINPSQFDIMLTMIIPLTHKPRLCQGYNHLCNKLIIIDFLARYPIG